VKNNFNLLRIFFAVFVVITHAYPLSGALSGDYLSQLTDKQVDFSFIGLSGFFIISGYLCYQSLQRSSTLFEYFTKRILRIYPALFFVLFLTIVLGGFVYEGSLREYLLNESIWSYLPANMSLVKQQGIITGIFTNNLYNPTVNGSLWSLLYEAAFYVGLAVLFFLKRRPQMYLVGGALLSILVLRFFFMEEINRFKFILEPRLVAEFAPFFISGSLLALVNIQRIKGRPLAVIILLVSMVLVLYLNCFHYARFFLLPPLVIFLGLGSIQLVGKFLEKIGDLSYGIYIYSFPIQQTLMHYFRFTTAQLMVTSILLSILAGYASWHLVEKKFLQYKRIPVKDFVRGIKSDQ
jgi:peptidoglycan/LPS O-acetylase OafA/YrhL